MIDYFRRKRSYRSGTVGQVYELTFRSSHHIRYFDDPLAVALFLRELKGARAAYRFNLFAYVVMPSHAHLVIGPADPRYDIVRIRNRIKKGFARKYAEALRESYIERYGCPVDDGKTAEPFAFWEPGAGEDRRLQHEDDIVDAIHYLETNPVRSFLTDTPEEWPGSSAYARSRRSGVMPDPLGGAAAVRFRPLLLRSAS